MTLLTLSSGMPRANFAAQERIRGLGFLLQIRSAAAESDNLNPT